MNRKINRIVSGGQTGVDRAAFDFALENNIALGGFIPKNRRAEDGVISLKYPNLCETKTEDYEQRTELNVIDSDATLILSRGELGGGSRLTKEFALKHKKPFLHIDFSALTLEDALAKTRAWLESTNCRILNIAGSRASEDAEIYDRTKMFLCNLW